MLIDQNSPWFIEFCTHSRDTAIKVSTIIARGISTERIRHGKTSILVMGGAFTGKTLVVEAITRDIADGYAAFKMPKNSLFEKEDGEAQMRYLTRKLFNQNKQFMAAFYRDSYSSEAETFKGLQKIFSYLTNPPCGRLTFKTSFGWFGATSQIKNFDKFDIVFEITDHPDITEDFIQFGARDWKIHIANPELRTPEMAEALDKLRTYEDHRKKRIKLQMAKHI